MVSLKELRRQAIQKLAEAKNNSPAADADFLLRALGFSKNDIILGDKTVDAKAAESFLKAVERVEYGEPVQYVAGGCEFMSMWFEVSDATLIPRCDTEILVEKVIGLCADRKPLDIFEVGSGSGCVAISLAKNLPWAKVVSADISAAALKVAKKNAKRLGVSDRVTFIEHDITKGFPKFSKLPGVVVSNPPYIPSADIARLDKKVKAFEPAAALDGGDDGLDFYRLISSGASLEKGGILALEVGAGQAQSVAKMLCGRFFDIEITKDLSGIDRVVTAKCAKKPDGIA